MGSIIWFISFWEGGMLSLLRSLEVTEAIKSLTHTHACTLQMNSFTVSFYYNASNIISIRFCQQNWVSAHGSCNSNHVEISSTVSFNLILSKTLDFNPIVHWKLVVTQSTQRAWLSTYVPHKSFSRSLITHGMRSDIVDNSPEITKQAAIFGQRCRKIHSKGRS